MVPLVGLEPTWAGLELRCASFRALGGKLAYEVRSLPDGPRTLRAVFTSLPIGRQGIPRMYPLDAQLGFEPRTACFRGKGATVTRLSNLNSVPYLLGLAVLIVRSTYKIHETGYSRIGSWSRSCPVVGTSFPALKWRKREGSNLGVQSTA